MENTDNRIGKKIRQFRILEGYTQKELADKCGLSESAIRNYELNIRTPDEETLRKISDALLINYYTLANTEIDSDMEAIHILFEMETLYGLVPEIVDDEVVLRIRNTDSDNKQNSSERIKTHLENWAYIRNRIENGTIDIGDYFLWKSTYPAFNKKLSDSDNDLESYSSSNSPFSGDGTSDRNPIVKLNNTIVKALNLGGTDKAVLDSNTKKQKNNKPPKGLTPEQLLFYNKYHKERNNIEE